MKICTECGQLVAEDIDTCPSCGAAVAVGRKMIDDYRITAVLHEGYSSILCKAVRDGSTEPVMIRIFTPRSGVDAEVAHRLRYELEQLQELPGNYFVRHLEIRQSSDGVWYRISEWVESFNWGTLLASGRLQDPQVALGLLLRMASILEGLHRIGHIIPHLILDDILIYEDEDGLLKVMIDYKLSRFLDPKLNCPGPMLSRLLTLHPDIVHQRPLDHRSDIWSLGKAFVEILSADPGATDLVSKTDSLPVPPEIKTLLRLMLSNNPDMRPQSMADVARTIAKVSDEAIAAAKGQRPEVAVAPVRVLQRLNVRLSLLLVLLVLLIIVGVLLWYYLGIRHADNESALKGYANQYAESVAFVVAEYWLQHNDQKVYRNRSEGTAFLADSAGYLLTNRHVACPWLEDVRLLMAIRLLRQRPGRLRFGYRLLLWFEGQRAFRRLPALSDDGEVADVYLTQQAYDSDGPRKVRIAGVARVPVRTLELVRSPLRDDFAVLKIDTIPPGLEPLPLDTELTAAAIPKLTPVITLGFPLGSRTQTTTVNVSVTQGHVRRAFENMFQVDTSIHPGNSGGPFIDTRGRVIGLASSVAVGWSKGPVPIATPLSDIGLVLPIAKAAALIEDLKGGAAKWIGVPDLALKERLERVRTEARQRNWDKARSVADKELAVSPSPSLIMTAAVMHLCASNPSGSRALLRKALSIDPGNGKARLLLLLIDWMAGSVHSSIERDSLIALDWRSSDEFWGYLARILLGSIDYHQALSGGYTASEKSWLHLIGGLFEKRQGKLVRAEQYLHAAVKFADFDSSGYFFAMATLEQLQEQRLAHIHQPIDQKEYRRQADIFFQQMDQHHEQTLDRHRLLRSALTELQNKETDVARRRGILKRLVSSHPLNPNFLISLAYTCAMDGDWSTALTYARQFLKKPGRQNAAKLSAGLLEPLLLQLLDDPQQAQMRLGTFYQRIDDPWYRMVSRCLLSPEGEPDISTKAGENPENLLTGHTALGLWAEGGGLPQAAIQHYREALESYLDNRIEYDLAKERIKRLRQEKKN
jgi:S1-C subfamily serine protease